MFELMLYPLLALIGISLLSGAYGCQMVWHRLACLGDALSHAAMLGLACGLLMHWSQTTSILILSVVWGFFLWVMTKRKKASTDTILAFLTQSSMALAILLYSFAGDSQTPLMHAFIGDVLLTSKQEVITIYCLDVLLGLILVFCWKKWLLIAVDEDLASAQNFSVPLYTFIFFVSVGFFVAESMQYLGALLAPAFFVMPPLIARNLSNTPKKMAIIATLIALVSAIFGVFISFLFDFPTGASIITIDVVLYLFENVILFIRKVLIKGC